LNETGCIPEVNPEDEAARKEAVAKAGAEFIKMMNTEAKKEDGENKDGDKAEESKEKPKEEKKEAPKKNPLVLMKE